MTVTSEVDNQQSSVNPLPSVRDISIAHRLKASANDKCRPIIVRFTNRRARESVLRAKKSLKTANLPYPVYIT